VSQTPLVTVAMPIFNAGQYLRAAVLSIVRQTYQDWELLLIDDGSTDQALESIRDICDSRIHIQQDGRNKGLAARLNEAIDMARGRYFARMDQDDVSYPERFAKQVAMLERDPQLDLLGVRAVTISMDDRSVGNLPFMQTHEQICARPWLGFYLPHPTWMGRIEWFRRHRYASPAPYLCEDQELLLRSHADSRFAILPEVLFAYRVRDHIQLGKQLRIRWSVLKVQLRHFWSVGDVRSAFLSLSAFLARVARDGIASRLFTRSMVSGRSPVGKGEEMQWAEVLAGLADDASRREAE
jgi:glycosyltransferase involved in cell wall biosynthesis